MAAGLPRLVAVVATVSLGAALFALSGLSGGRASVDGPPGDADCDGLLTLADALRVQRIIVGLEDQGCPPLEEATHTPTDDSPTATWTPIPLPTFHSIQCDRANIIFCTLQVHPAGSWTTIRWYIRVEEEPEHEVTGSRDSVNLHAEIPDYPKSEYRVFVRYELCNSDGVSERCVSATAPGIVIFRQVNHPLGYAECVGGDCGQPPLLVVCAPDGWFVDVGRDFPNPDWPTVEVTLAGQAQTACD